MATATVTDGDSDSGDYAFNNQQMLQVAMECRGGADCGGGGDDDDDRIDKHPVRAAMAMVMAMTMAMARVTLTVAAAAGRWRPQPRP